MRLVIPAMIGITAANAGFGAGLVGTILVGPWTGAALPAVTMGYAVGAVAMLSSFAAALRLAPSRRSRRSDRPGYAVDDGCNVSSFWP